MRPLCEASKETEALILFFKSMPVGGQLSYGDVSRRVGFAVTPSNSKQARDACERDHKVFIGIIRGVGFFRGSGIDGMDSLPSFDKKIRRCAKRAIRRTHFALSQNLPDSLSREAGERLGRYNIIVSTTETRGLSNRPRREPPPPPDVSPPEKGPGGGYGAIAKIRK